jgi:cytochrome c5
MNVFTTTATVTGLGIALVLMGQSGGTHLAEARSTVVGPEPAGAAAVLASVSHGVSTGSTAEDTDRLALEMLHDINGGAAADVSAATLTEVVRTYCQVCHNDVMLTGNLSLSEFEVERAAERAETAEKMIVKLRAGMMPPPGMPRPSADTLQALVETLETSIDEAAARNPNPGSRTFQRLNRAEYEASIRDLLGLEVDAAQYLPLDTKSANFDNIADVQMLSPTLLDAYLNGASEISRLALGDRDASPKETLYHLEKRATQMVHVEGTPYGSRGGISVVHTFPADAEYVFWLQFEAVGKRAQGEQLEISFDGERVALLDIDLSDAEYADPGSSKMETDPIFVRAGPKRISAAFVKKFEGPVEEVRAPLGRSVQGGWPDLMLTTLPHLRDLAVAGPYNVTGVSETASRERIFTCRPTSPSEARPCAEEIIVDLASEAYRRPLTDQDLRDLMGFYEEGEARGGFESGIRFALQATLASPHFVFRFEEAPAGVDWEEPYRLTDIDLASRLSFFLWGSPPDEELTDLAQRRRLSDSGVFEDQVRRLLEDPRSEALATRFASQWLRLQDLDKVSPDQYTFPYFDMSLSDAMRRETELFFYNLVREDRSILELLTGDYTFVNERLAQHYGIPNVAGSQFRRVLYPDDRRRGLLGQGSILMLTSMANRTSPVLRGKWVMDVILNAPPPPPPPDVPALESTDAAVEGRFLTTRERMEKHRENPTCYACHQYMDPIGLALDNFDVTGKWRIRENGMALDTRGQLYDGTPLATPSDLSEALLKMPIPFVRAFTANLMAYALGRRIEYYDQPTVRAISREAEANDYRMSSFIMSVVTSDQFQMKGPAQVVVEEAESGR